MIKKRLSFSDMNGKIPAFLSFDVELDGPTPMCHSMLSLGIALFTENTGIVDTFYLTLFPQKNEKNEYYPPSTVTMENFWRRFPNEWKHVNQNQVEPSEAMSQLANWLFKYHHMYEFKWVASPSCSDFGWLKCYYEKYGPPQKIDIGHYCHDLSSLFRAYCLCHNISDTRGFMKLLAGDAIYNHHALYDAIYQGRVYMNLRRLLNKQCVEKIDYIPGGLKIVTQTYDLQHSSKEYTPRLEI